MNLESLTLVRVLRPLRLDASTWLPPRRATVVGAAVASISAFTLLALNRFGGQGIATPRAPVRFVLTGFYSWIALAGLLWLSARFTNHSNGSFQTLRQFVTLSGAAHFPVIVLGLVLFVSVGLFQLVGPGLVAAVFVFAFWMPAMLVAGTKWVFGLRIGRAMGVVAVPYLAWLATTGRYVLSLVGHLL